MVINNVTNLMGYIMSKKISVKELNNKYKSLIRGRQKRKIKSIDKESKRHKTRR